MVLVLQQPLEHLLIPAAQESKPAEGGRKGWPDLMGRMTL
jgi:hypothetical protein